MDEVENDFCKFWFSDGILHSTFKVPVDSTLEIAIKKIELRHYISKNEPQYWCMDIRNLRSISKDSNDYIEKNGQELVHACAAIVETRVAKFMVDVFNLAKKPKVPLKVFTNQAKAIEWLSELKNGNVNT